MLFGPNVSCKTPKIGSFVTTEFGGVRYQSSKGISRGPETSDSEQHSPTAAQHFPICIDSDSDDDDCGYAGGVDVCLDSEKELEGMDENDEWSDTESLENSVPQSINRTDAFLKVLRVHLISVR
jgi:hypothetical protein